MQGIQGITERWKRKMAAMNTDERRWEKVREKAISSTP
jgi:hypothetical protein